MAGRSNLTDYTAQNSFTMKRPGNSVATFAFDTDPDRPGIIQLTVPPGSTWKADLHWHERYTEYLTVIKGRALLTLNNESRVVTPDDGPQIVEKFVVHEWGRADRVEAGKDDEDLIVEEWTDPGDGLKQVFFRNLLGVLNDGQYWRSWFPIQALLICAEYDNFNQIVPGTFSYITTHSIFGMIGLVSKMLGLKPWYKEYTPANLRAIAQSRAVSASK